MSNVIAVVAAHGALARGLVSAVQAITGLGDCLAPVSNEGMSPNDVTSAMRTALDATGASAVFTDLPAGSCTIAARRLQKERPALDVVVGVNLPMLLEFVLRESHGRADLEAAVERGREHLRLIPAAHVG